MNLTVPKLTSLPTVGIWKGREKVSAAFLQRHNEEVNLELVYEAVEENKIKIEPHKWLALIEGHRRYHSRENIYIDSVINDFEITARDPIKQPFSVEIADAASISKILAALSVLATYYVDYSPEERSDELLRLWFEQTVDSIARAFDVSAKTLEDEFDKLRWENEDSLTKQISFLEEQKQRLIVESNRQSKITLSQILTEHPKIFIVCGIAHSSVFVEDEQKNLMSEVA